MRCASCLAVHLTAPPGWSLLILTRETTQCAGAACRIIMEAGLPFCDKLFFVTAASERTNHGRPVNYREQKESEKMERKPSNWGQNEMLMLPQLFGGSFSTRLPSKMKPEPVILSHIHVLYEYFCRCCRFSSVGIGPSVGPAPHGEGHQAEKGIDSAQLILTWMLFIVCHQNTSPTAINTGSMSMQYTRALICSLKNISFSWVTI